MANLAMATLPAPLASAGAFTFDNSFARELPGFYVAQRPAIVRAPRLLYLNRPLAEELGLDLDSLDDEAKAAVFAGNTVPDGAEPLAQAYAGHQFGGFSPQTRRRPRATSRRGDRSSRTSSRHRVQGVGPHAVRPRRRRQGGRWTHASRGADQRGDARAGHPHDARPCRRSDRRAGVSRRRAARRGADTRRGEPHPRRYVSVLCRARRRRKRAQTRRVHDRATRPRTGDHAAAISRTVAATWPSARRR